LAQASQAVIIGFNVVPDEAARSLADDLQAGNSSLRHYLPKLPMTLRRPSRERLKPEQQVVEVGMAMVLQAFSISSLALLLAAA
jgi:translation initiation factor IF-2